MNALTLRPVGQLLGPFFPDLAAAVARRLATRPLHHSRHPDPPGAEPLTFRFGLAGLRWGSSGPRVLALHGWEGRAAQFRRLGESLAARGYQLIAMDAPAHGRSPGSEADPVVFADALAEVAAELGPLHGVVGHSMGGASTLYALSQGLRTRRAVVIAAPAGLGDVLVRMAHRLGLPAEATRRFFAAMERRTGRPVAALDVEALVSPPPLLVIHDRDDAVVPFHDGARIAASTGAELLATTGLGHRDILRDPQTIDRITGFFARV